jgi:methylmalonyl-CoA/ethylmalonyl-CoA epimerase
LTGPQPGDRSDAITDGASATRTFHQVAWIVADLDAGVDRMRRMMGWEPWDVYEYVPGRVRELTVDGQPAEFTWAGAEVAIGPETYIELLQPTSPSGIFYDWLQAHGEGMHHVGYWAPSVDAAERVRREMTDDGARVLLSAWIDDVYFYYLDTRPMIYEVWAGDMASVAPTRRIVASGP